jgi:hypothetical protein
MAACHPEAQMVVRDRTVFTGAGKSRSAGRASGGTLFTRRGNLQVLHSGEMPASRHRTVFYFNLLAMVPRGN